MILSDSLRIVSPSFLFESDSLKAANEELNLLYNFDDPSDIASSNKLYKIIINTFS
jgi:hypothetical protein